MRFSSFSILIIFVLLAGIGLTMLPRLNLQLLPSRTYASLTVSTMLPDAPPMIIEELVTSPLEGALARLGGIAQMQSISGHGSSQIMISLDQWTDPAAFRFETAAILRQWYPNLPASATYPTVRLNQSLEDGREGPLLSYSLHGPATLEDIARFAEREIPANFSDIRGIRRIDIQSPPEKQWVIAFEHAKWQQFDLQMQEVQQQLSVLLTSQGIGVVQQDDHAISLHLGAGDRQPDGLLELPLTGRDGQIFFVGDVATVQLERPAPHSFYRINGQEQVHVDFYADGRVNTILLAQDIQERMQEGSWLPVDYGYTLQYDQTKYMKEELDKIYLRTFLSVGLLLLFVILITRQVRYLLIVIFSLVANVLLAFSLYVAFDLDIHLYSLAGVTISLGLIVDNIIVVVEDLRHTGRNRIFAAILASTATALVALSVIFLLDEHTRVNLFDFALVIILNLLLSLPIAYYLIPAILTLYPVTIHNNATMFRRRRFLVRFSDFYQRQLNFMLKYRRFFILIFVLILGIPIFLLPNRLDEESQPFGMPYFTHGYNATIGSTIYQNKIKGPMSRWMGGIWYEYWKKQTLNASIPVEDADQETRLQVGVSMPIGSTIFQMDAVVRDFEVFIGERGQDISIFSSRVSSGVEASIQVVFQKKHDALAPFQLKRALEQKAVHAGAADFDIHGVGQGFSNALNLNDFDSSIGLKGFNYPQLEQIAERIRDSLLANFRVQDVFVSPDPHWVRRSSFEHVIELHDRQQLALLGIYPSHIAKVVESWGGYEFPVARTEDNETVMIRIADRVPPPLWVVSHTPLPLDDTGFVRLAPVSSIHRRQVGDRVIRENQYYVLFVNYRYLGSHMANFMLQEQISEASQSWMPMGFDFHERSNRGGKGQFDQALFWLIPMVLLLIYMVCAILLESFMRPFAVVAMIPFSFIGVLFVFYTLDLRFDQGGYAVLLLLCGLVTNAALYIINDLNYFNKTHKQPIQRYIRAFHAKAMPILVTTAAAVLSLLPFMISGDDKGFWFTLSAGTIGGLLFSLLGVYLLLPLCLLKRPALPASKLEIDG